MMTFPLVFLWELSEWMKTTDINYIMAMIKWHEVDSSIDR